MLIESVVCLRGMVKTILCVFLCMCCSMVAAQETIKCEEDSLLREIDLPLLEIWTVAGELPTGENVVAPSGLWGIALVNNEYVYGRMQISRRGDVLYDSGAEGMKIRLRGNSSSTDVRKPYKIKLDKKADLMFRDDAKYIDKDWVLLPMSHNHTARVFTGVKIGELVGLEWKPECEYINVVLNGVYWGDYLLFESVEREKGRVNIDKTGFLIEDDAYWWSEDVYFKGNLLLNQVGFTFKYPETEDLNDSIISNIKNFILDYESALVNGEDVTNYIDLQNWAAWLLAQDLLGQKDAAGTNRYIYKQDFDVENPFSSQLKMGPLWDFDGSLHYVDEWALIHNGGYGFYFAELLKREDFNMCYLQLWERIKDGLYDELISYYDDLSEKKGEGITKSRALYCSVYKDQKPSTMDEEMNFAKTWMKNRIEWIDGQLTKTSIEELPALDMPSAVYNIYGRKIGGRERLERGIYIIDGRKVLVK